MREFTLEGTAIDNNAIIRLRDTWQDYLLEDVDRAGYIPAGSFRFRSTYFGGGFRWTLSVPAVSPTDS